MENGAGAGFPLDFGGYGKVLAGFAGNGHAHRLAVFAAGPADGAQQGAAFALQGPRRYAPSVKMHRDNAGPAQRLDLLAEGGAGFKFQGSRLGLGGGHRYSQLLATDERAGRRGETPASNAGGAGRPMARIS